MPNIGKTAGIIAEETYLVTKKVAPAVAEKINPQIAEKVTLKALEVVGNITSKTEGPALKLVDNASLTNVARNTAGKIPATTSLTEKLTQAPARLIDFLTGHSKVNISTLYNVEGASTAKWADEFLKNPSNISPISSGVRHEGSVIIGKPFPGGPDIGILLKKRQDITTAGVQKTILDLEYSGAFEGPGRITITKSPNAKMTVHDEWFNLKNNSFLPSLGAENGHPIVAGLGFKGIASKAIGQTPNVVADAAGMIVSMSFKAMTLPFSFFK